MKKEGICIENSILACIGLSPSSARIIHKAKKMADAYNSKWIVLYVETTKAQNLSKEDKKRLEENFNLVEYLGGEIVTLYSENVVEQIIQYAKFRNIAKIIIGKNHKKKFSLFQFYEKDIADKIIDFNSYVDIYIVPSFTHKKKNKSNILNLNFKFNLSLNDIIKSMIIMLVVTVISKVFNMMNFREANIILVFVLGVIIVYIVTNGYAMGIVSSIIAVILFNYLFAEPKYSLQFYDKNYLALFPMILAVSFIIGTLTNKVKMEAVNSLAREKRTQILYSISRKLLSAAGPKDVVAIGIKYISRLVERNVICYLANGNKLSTPFIYDENDKYLLTKDEKIAAYWAFSKGEEAGKGTNAFYEAKGYYIPLKIKKEVFGVIGVSCNKGVLKKEQKFIFETAAGQIAIALDREILSKKQEASKIEIESERLRSNLLRSVSHDLRTPLAGIKGAVSTILENGEYIPKELQDELLTDVYEDTEWLIRLVENLLNMTKFDDKSIKIKKNMEVVEEVISEAVQRSLKHLEKHKLKVDIPENVLIIPMDGNLIEQVIINLIDNAIKFSPKESLIEIKVYEQEKNVFFEVEDNGIGIPKEILPRIFDRFFTDGSKISDSRRGVGLGLAICQSIVRAHGGQIKAYNKNQGGTIFRFNIPKEG